tara:strand:+ start:695 stop:961 length:267 start_codon:yes stop_codon:yes gene_type:complete
MKTLKERIEQLKETSTNSERTGAYLTVLNMLRGQKDASVLEQEIKDLKDQICDLEKYMDNYSYYVKQESGKLDRESHKFASRIGYKKN